jgi:hypothetical protein
VTFVTASILPFRRQTQGHGLTADDLDRLEISAQYLPGQRRLDVAIAGEGGNTSRVWLRSQSEELATFPDIGFTRVAGIVWVTTKHYDDRLGTPFATVDAAILLLCAIMSSDEAIGPSQRPRF